MMCNDYTGTLGETLSTDPDLYISRNGGVTWHQTLSSSYGVNVLDHGGVVVAVNDYHQVSSTQLKYSCDEVLSWNSFTFTDVRGLYIMDTAKLSVTNNHKHNT